MEKPHSSAVRFLCSSLAFFFRPIFASKFSSNLFFRLRLLLLSFCPSNVWIRPARLHGAEDDDDEGSSQCLSEEPVLIMDGSCPMLVPVHVVTSMIKSRIPVLEFGDYVERRRRRLAQGEGGWEAGEDPSGCCAVCLGTIEWGDVIREPSNCDHVFHRDCLDRWIGEHRVTCPLCRCIMLPARRNITFC
ncbi:hypothetical protein MLD38_016627 [Melastoma candidum]|uniref:Uncharacterized protein n=1 Tax=Melastoma candidum TaxID=119954 RepID=A0ACB9QRG3_9MYRT|nr:hypothetical protein MLD38_016627 [Melastoma candidum]